MDAYVSEGVQNHPKASHNSSSSCRRPIDASRGGALKVVSEVLFDVLERIATRRLLREIFDEEEEEDKEEETTRRPTFAAGMTTRFFCVLLLARDALWHKR